MVISMQNYFIKFINKHAGTWLQLAIFASLSCLPWTAGQAQEEEPGTTENTADQREQAIARARHFLSLDNAAAREYTKQMSPEQAKALMTQVLNLKRQTNPDLDRMLVLVQHLDNIRASELAQARLDKLLLVLSLVLVLFSLYLLFLVLDQKRTLQKMQHMLEQSGAVDQKQADNQVFRG